MGNTTSHTRIAACHASPILLDAKETTKKTVSLVREAAAHGANIVVFPESFIPAFPVWSAPRAPTENHEFFRRMATESVFADGEEIAAVRGGGAAARRRPKCFGVLCAGVLDEEAAALLSFGSSDGEAVMQGLLRLPRGATMFLDTTGALLPGFTFADKDDKSSEKCVTEYLQKEEGILYAHVDLDACIEGKQYHDVAGGYQRLDVFELKVDRTRREPVVFK
ncbi:hypothetical protein F4811DRAFT_556293 [Daldinia bambusicola]|nr:hypothetical protein F4811DRAFT_556293 [Daldinia bambusicola]